MKDLTVSLEDRPGTLADLGEALGKAGINIEGLCVITSEGRSIGHFLVQYLAAARTALEGAGIKVEGEAEPLIWEPPPTSVDRPGAMGESARAAANAGVNIQLLYLATRNRVVLITSDNQKAAQALAT